MTPLLLFLPRQKLPQGVVVATRGWPTKICLISPPIPMGTPSTAPAAVLVSLLPLVESYTSRGLDNTGCRSAKVTWRGGSTATIVGSPRPGSPLEAIAGCRFIAPAHPALKRTETINKAHDARRCRVRPTMAVSRPFKVPVRRLVARGWRNRMELTSIPHESGRGRYAGIPSCQCHQLRNKRVESTAGGILLIYKVAS